ncbi:MAG: hypothetical protein B7Z08_08655, partial [Sphingomonadales bacterium 32-68-7]
MIGQNSRRRTALVAALLAGAVTFPAPGVSQTASAAQRCERMIGTELRPGLTVTAARHLAASAARPAAGPGAPPAPALPAHCRLEGTIDPHKGTDGKDYAIGFALALPDTWNGRFLLQGGGGLNGSVGQPIGPVASGERSALARGFAVISHDSGHKGAGFDDSFMSDQRAALNFAEASVRTVTLDGKALTERFYGRKIDHSYMTGCSTGGREGMLAAQRYPELFDGIVVGVLQATNKKLPVQSTPRSGRQPDFSLLTFSSNEAMMLNYIASNAGLALMQFSSPASTDTEHMSYPFSPHNPEEVVVETYRPSRSNSISKQHLADFRADKGMQGLMQSIYQALDADRVSMFTYSADGNNLVCALSQDIEGFSIPTDRGYAGYSFTAMRMVNVADIKADGRHYGEVDSRVGYVTRNLLCAPIMTSDGSPVGVIQAVNKRNGPCFTLTDEQQLMEVCKRIVALLQARG